MATSKSTSVAAATYSKSRGPISLTMARAQNKQVTTQKQAIKELKAAGILTAAGNLKAKFK